MNKVEKERDSLLSAVEKYKAKAASSREALGEMLTSKKEAIAEMRERMDAITQATLLGGLTGLVGNALVLKVTELLKSRIPGIVEYRKYLEGLVAVVLLWLGNSNKMVKSEQSRAFMRAAGMSMMASLITPFVNNMLGAGVNQLAISGSDESVEGYDDSGIVADTSTMLYGAAVSGIDPSTVVMAAETGVIPAALIPLLIQAGRELAPIAQEQIQRWQAEMQSRPNAKRRMRKVAEEGRNILASPAVKAELQRLMAQYQAQQPGFTPRPRELTAVPQTLMPTQAQGALIPETSAWGSERRQERRQDRREAVLQPVLQPSGEVTIAPTSSAQGEVTITPSGA